ncbi:MAG: SBBP repeat-containing protein [Planctomycetes bacterium]|nr:SBBP repeat-containing protein [Planctomycetota bacterium]
MPFLLRAASAVFALALAAPSTAKADALDPYGRIPLRFEENRGQADRRAAFLCRAPGYTLYLLKSTSEMSASAVIRFRHAEGSTVVRMDICGARPDARAEGLDPLASFSHYFKGADPSAWVRDVPHWGRVRVREVYPGIDIAYFASDRSLEYDFILRPGADPERIVLAFEGMLDLRIDDGGDLVLRVSAAGREVRVRRPVAYQPTEGEPRAIAGRFVARGERRIGFEIGPYDRTRPLVIDPTLSYSTFLGGSGWDIGYSIAVDSHGKAYITGSTVDDTTDFPTTNGVYDTTHNGNSDAFVAKLTADGSGLEYSTFLGGSGDDAGYGIAIDSSGNAYLTGTTADAVTDFPTTGGAYDTGHNGGKDVFAAKLTSDGSGLTYSTFLGGSGDDEGRGIAVDASGKAYVTGSTADDTTDFPTTNGVYDTTHNGANDVFVAKLSSDGSGLDYSTFLGGSGNDLGRGIRIDSGGRAYVTGYTADAATDFPATDGAYDTGHNGGNDAFVAKLNADASDLDYSTFLGGSGSDEGYAIAIDSGGMAYVTGSTADDTTDFPTTDGAYDTSHGGGPEDVFVTKVNADGSDLEYSSFLGGENVEMGYGIAVDGNGCAFLTGLAYTGFPTSNAFQSSPGGDTDAFVAAFNSAGSGLCYSSYHGGSAGDVGCAIAVDASGSAYVTGYTDDGVTDMPVTDGAYDTSQNGQGDAFAIKVTFAESVADLVSFSAERAADGRVLLRWRTGYETDNLGFHLWREEGGCRSRITRGILAGSALLAGTGTALEAGSSYAWWDAPSAQASRVDYWLEEIDLAGRRISHGPYPVTRSPFGIAPSRVKLASLLTATTKATAEGMARVAGRTAPARIPEDGDPAQWGLAAGSAIKLVIREEGWYRVHASALAAAGLDPAADPHGLRLIADGAEQSIRVADGGVEFYGMGVDDPSGDARVYWLVWGAEAGRRLLPAGRAFPAISRALRTGVEFRARSFLRTIERADRSIFLAAVRNGDAENFFGPLVTAEPVEQILPVRHMDRASSFVATLEVAIRGVSPADHRVSLTLNGVRLGAMAFSGAVRDARRLIIPASLIEDGDNVLVLTAEGGQTDVSAVETIRITYARRYAAEGDALACPAPPWKAVTIGGFSGEDVEVMDVTDPESPRPLPGKVQPCDAGREITVVPRGPGERRLLAFASTAVRMPAAIIPNVPSAWHAEGRGADEVIVAPRAFLDRLEPLVGLRREQGISVALAAVEDIYDEFAYGRKSPSAIRAFLRRALAVWEPAPRFLLLAGDATWDPRGRLGGAEGDLVPTMLVETSRMETASDDGLGDFDGDGVPEIAVGRIPARTADDLAAAAAKIAALERAGAWNRPAEILLVADENGGYDFGTEIEAIGRLLSPAASVRTVRRDEGGTREAILQALAGAPRAVAYAGHGSVQVWAGGILDSSDAGATASPIPLFVCLTCLNGFFHDLFTKSLAESLIEAQPGGAAAVWASSGATPPPAQIAMGRELLRILVDGDAGTLGEAVLEAKSAIDDSDVRRTWILFGDPATRIR